MVGLEGLRRTHQAERVRFANRPDNQARPIAARIEIIAVDRDRTARRFDFRHQRIDDVAVTPRIGYKDRRHCVVCKGGRILSTGRLLQRRGGRVVVKKLRHIGPANLLFVSLGEGRLQGLAAGDAALGQIEQRGDIGLVIREAFKKIDAQSGRGALTGIASGFYDLDDMLGGFNQGEMTIIAARPSMGKTAFVLNLMEHAVMNRAEHLQRDATVLFFSLEMGSLSIVQRMLCSRARVDAHKLRTGRIPSEDYAQLNEAAGELAAPLRCQSRPVVADHHAGQSA